jgi:hypothetical protein
MSPRRGRREGWCARMYGLWGEECYRRSATGRSGWSRGSSCVSPRRVSRADLQIKLKCFLGLTACYYPPPPLPWTVPAVELGGVEFSLRGLRGCVAATRECVSARRRDRE